MTLRGFRACSFVLRFEGVEVVCVACNRLTV